MTTSEQARAEASMTKDMTIRPTSETDPQGFDTRHAISILKAALAQVPAKQERARMIVYRAYRHLETKAGGRALAQVLERSEP